MTERTKIYFEALKVSLRQSKDGINITLAIHPDDVEAELMADPIGSRYHVWVERVDDDEKPVERSALNFANTDFTNREQTEALLGKVAPALRSGLEGGSCRVRIEESPLRKAQRGIVSSAAIVCRDPKFQAFLYKTGRALELSEEGAAEGLRSFLGIKSRVDLAHSERARRLFIELRQEFERKASE